jgi:hypothetical protein
MTEHFSDKKCARSVQGKPTGMTFLTELTELRRFGRLHLYEVKEKKGSM